MQSVLHIPRGTTHTRGAIWSGSKPGCPRRCTRRPSPTLHLLRSNLESPRPGTVRNCRARASCGPGVTSAQCAAGSLALPGPRARATEARERARACSQPSWRPCHRRSSSPECTSASCQVALVRASSSRQPHNRHPSYRCGMCLC